MQTQAAGSARGGQGRRWVSACWRPPHVAAALLGAAWTALALTASAGVAAAPAPPAQTAPPPGTNAAARAELLAGQWEGTWSSASGRMGGTLRCEITRRADGAYLARFRSRYARIFTHRSEVILRAAPEAKLWRFRGEKDLGFLAGGVFRYEGQSDGGEFRCTYVSAHHKGTFRMRRAGG
jgi:hypothetical protein